MQRYRFDERTPEQLELHVPVGTQMAIELQGLATAGYEWSARSDTPHLVAEDDNQPEAPEAAAIKAGTERPVVFRILPSRPGDFQVVFSLQRRGEAAPARTHKVVIKSV